MFLLGAIKKLINDGSEGCSGGFLLGNLGRDKDPRDLKLSSFLSLTRTLGIPDARAKTQGEERRGGLGTGEEREEERWENESVHTLSSLTKN